MKNLATRNQNDFAVTETGDAYVSNRKLSALIGVPESTLRDYFRAQKISITQGVSYEYLPKTAHKFASKGNKQALDFVLKLSEAGAKAYIYHEAGYVMKAVRPKTKLELAREQVKLLEDIEAMEELVRLKNNEIFDLLVETTDLKEKATKPTMKVVTTLYNLPRT